MTKPAILFIVLCSILLVIFTNPFHFSFNKVKELKGDIKGEKGTQTETQNQKDDKDKGANPKESQGDNGRNLVVQAKDTLQKDVLGASNSINNFIEQTAGNLLPKNSKNGTVEISVSPSQIVDQDLIQIDLLKDRKLKIKITKDKESYFKFQNVPSDFCLYLNQKKYPIESGKIVSIKLPERGTYPISFDFCDAEIKNIGEILVY